MVSTYHHDKLTWIDLESPSVEEITQLVKTNHIHPLVGQELLSPTYRSKVDYYKNHIYLILHFPTLGRGPHGETTNEIDFIISKNTLITVHYAPFPSLYTFRKSLETCSVLERGCGFEHAGALFFYMVRDLYKESEAYLDVLLKNIRRAEEKIFSGEEGEMVSAVSDVHRKLLDFKEATRFHKDVLESFKEAGNGLFGKEYGLYTESLLGDYYKVWNIIESLRETVLDLRDTNDSLLTYKTNEVIKFLTMLTFIALPLSIVPNFFTTDVIVGQEHNLFAIFAITLVLSLLMYFFFKFKRWI